MGLAIHVEEVKVVRQAKEKPMAMVHRRSLEWRILTTPITEEAFKWATAKGGDFCAIPLFPYGMMLENYSDLFRLGVQMGTIAAQSNPAVREKDARWKHLLVAYELLPDKEPNYLSNSYSGQLWFGFAIGTD